MLFYDFFSQGGKIQTEKKSAFQLVEERGKTRGFGPSDGWTVGPVSPRGSKAYTTKQMLVCVLYVA